VSDADVVVIVNPNNPTGTVMASARIIEFASMHPERIFIVDESFIDFSGQPSVISLVENLALSNVIVVKSLSKCLGVPGLRLGFVYTSHPEMKRRLWSDIPIWNVNAIAENFLEIILKHRVPLDESFRRVCSDRAAFAARLEHIPIVDRVFPSGGNFLLIRLRTGQALTEILANRLMEDHSVHVKDASDKFYDGSGYFRLAVRCPEENDRLCELLTVAGAL
jgi:histidinol-phosphate/aromatic aminotransferase/cobyric acid decarboxylase-like protein